MKRKITKKIYHSWREFRPVLESRLFCNFTEAMWETLQDQLFWAAIHEPFTNGDIDIAVKMAQKLRSRWGK